MFGLPKRRVLRALQVEVTSRCTRRCATCPRSALSDRWQESDLSGGTWERLARDLKLARHVHLQGWGEPLLHPELRRMVHDCKTSGCSVGITTNGDLLEPATSWMVAEAVDLVTVSVGGDPLTPACFEKGSRLEEVLNSVGRLSRLSGRGRGKTRIQLSYLLTRDNASQLPALVRRAARAGPAEIFVIHLDCTPSSDLLRMSAFEEEGLAAGVGEHLDTAARIARRHAIRFRGPALRPRELLACALDPTRFAFVTADGRTGPCVYGLLPISGLVPRFCPGGDREVVPAYYGDLREAGLAEILEGPLRREFALPFEHRLQAERDFFSSVPAEPGVEALRRLEAADREREHRLAASPFPSACDGCHKARGW
jgi:MoaA/NifB/PqqE/SkfB family radical SAM enzyme